MVGSAARYLFAGLRYDLTTLTAGRESAGALDDAPTSPCPEEGNL